MPRIPQGEFDTNPSTRVAAHSAQRAPDALDNVGKQLGNLTGAMALLQDQSERTEAYSTANKIKQEYLQKKAVYGAALETVNGSGMADFFDPTDANPDISKRKRIQRPIQEMYKEMVDSYEESKKSTDGMARKDIADDLMRQYVGDDLIQLQMGTNKHINRVREKETEREVTENLELNLSAFTEAATSPDATPETINLHLARMNNKMQREIGTVANILGTEKVKNMGTMLDRAYGSAASQIVSSGVTDSTVLAAENLVKKIKDPSQRSVATTRLENAKRSTAQVKAVSMFNSVVDYNQKLMAADVLKPDDEVQAGMAVRSLLGVYTNEKYTPGFTQELKQEKAADLMSTLLAKKMIQQGIDTDLRFVDEMGGSRSPSGESVMDPKHADLENSINKEIESFSAGLGTNVDLAGSVRAMTVEKMKSLRNSAKDNLPEIIDAKYPGLNPRERIARIQLAADAQGFGDVGLVTKKTQTEFKQTFLNEHAKSGGGAVTVVQQFLHAAGEATEGEASYRRAMMADLVGKDKNLAFLIPLADASMSLQHKMLENAKVFKQKIDETDASQNDFQLNFESQRHRMPALEAVMKSNPSLYEGIKQAIFHSASTRINGKSDIPSAMKDAIEEMTGELYSSTSVGRSSVLLVNTNGKNFSKQKQITIERGVTQATRLPMMTPEQKIELLKEYNPRAIGKKEDGSWNPAPPANKVDWYLQQLVAIEPDGRYPNMQVFKINGVPLSDKDGKDIKITADELLSYGLEQEKQIDRMTGR